MNANELRIGNLVKINNDLLPETKGQVYSVYGINERFDKEFPESKNVVSLRHKSHNARYVRTYSQFDEFIEPIPLTDEWLVKFGFEKSYKSFVKGDFTFITNHGLAYKLTIITNLPKYVHQLQNLYFALTGEELEIEKTEEKEPND